jgi:hypothetical protein
MNKNTPSEKNAKVVPVSKSIGDPKKPNEQYGFYFSSSLKITDPQSGKVLIQMRCD